MKIGVWSGATALVFTGVALAAAPRPDTRSTAVRRGEYLVALGGCNDCHTPWKMGANGPEPDRTRLLSGHPGLVAVPGPPAAHPPWVVAASDTFTAWSGPWGVSFSANLTPDPETGIGGWDAQTFVTAMRTGRHRGRGRPMLPPMPWQNYREMTDADLKAMFAYLQSIPAIRNRVPDPVLREEVGSGRGDASR